MRILVLAVGQVESDSLRFLADGLKEVFPETNLEIAETPMPLLGDAYSRFRRQYNSTQILTKMLDYVNDVQGRYILGVTSVDLYVPKLNLVFGEAQPASRTALISLFRLRQEFYGKPPDSQLFHLRGLKEAVHELGHTLGLAHCHNPSCVMFFSNSIQDTDRKKAKFCDDCHLIVHRMLEK